MRKGLLFIGLLLFILMTGRSQNLPEGTKVDSAVFSFKSGDDYFYLDYDNNRSQWKRLRKTMLSEDVKQWFVIVKGFGSPSDNRKNDLKFATTASNRVKSALIVRGMIEQQFLTSNRSFVFSKQKEKVYVTLIRLKPKWEKQSPIGERQPIYVYEVYQTQKQMGDLPKGFIYQEPPKELSRIMLSTNLLYWLLATPNLGIGVRVSEKYDIIVNGVLSNWSWGNNTKRHKLWLVQPEVRRYLDKDRSWFVGLEGHIGQFNLKLDETGNQGDIFGGGLIGGYRMNLNRHFDMDFSLGLGYTRIEYDSYYRNNGYMVRKKTDMKRNFFGPTKAGVSLIYTF
ncbi:MAG: DUF3575 domain-containing protein [Culturomica sp.]|jgi:hypothetical protein|nr:DUF3575 domain-containing protein [Culturomica sp.]